MSMWKGVGILVVERRFPCTVCEGCNCGFVWNVKDEVCAVQHTHTPPNVHATVQLEETCVVC